MEQDTLLDDTILDRILVPEGRLWNETHGSPLGTFALHGIRFDDIKDEYAQLYSSMVIAPAKLPMVDRFLGRMLASKARYEAVASASGVPWHVIAAIHLLEAGLSFTGHLHNGDPLTARTVQVPAGRPVGGSPPFTWEESAADAPSYDGLTDNADWSIERTAFEFERFNGWGYRMHHPEVRSPYLWSFSNHYAKGKYVADGHWDGNAVSVQCGGMVMVRRMADQGVI